MWQQIYQTKLLWFEITKMLTAAFKIKYTALFIKIFCTLSFPNCYWTFSSINEITVA